MRNPPVRPATSAIVGRLENANKGENVHPLNLIPFYEWQRQQICPQRKFSLRQPVDLFPFPCPSTSYFIFPSKSYNNATRRLPVYQECNSLISSKDKVQDDHQVKAYKPIEDAEEPLGAGLVDPDVPYTTPTLVLPFPDELQTSRHSKNFDYRLFLSYATIPKDGECRIVYGNLPYFSYKTLHLVNDIGEVFIANLNKDLVDFIAGCKNLLASGPSHLHPDDYRAFSWTPPAARAHGHIVYRFPIVELLVGLATLFINYPEGTHAKISRKSHLDTAQIIFASPPPSPPPHSS